MPTADLVVQIAYINCEPCERFKHDRNRHEMIMEGLRCTCKMSTRS